MNVPTTDSADIGIKIGRLVEERGWNQEDFARIANLNRHTVRTILNGSERKLRNATVQACARALGLTVSELRALPLDRLLPRMQGQDAGPGDDRMRQLFSQLTHPDLMAWLKRNEERAQQLTPSEVEELLTLQSDGGPVAAIGPDRVIELLERKRELLRRVHAIAATEYMSMLEQIVALMYEKTRT
ncbi:MAG: helix-turn-helix transcriptional regulator [Candidatus Udaeobacter sp.]